MNKLDLILSIHGNTRWAQLLSFQVEILKVADKKDDDKSENKITKTS